MKNIILILCAAFIMSCSNDESSSLKVTRNNIEGTWYFSEVVQPDGSRKPYISSCESIPDKIVITQTNLFITITASDCEFESLYQCAYRLNVEPRKITVCYPYVDGTVKSLNRTTLEIQYDNIQHFGREENNFDLAAGVVFRKE